jgi:hypothetical protein
MRAFYPGLLLTICVALAGCYTPTEYKQILNANALDASADTSVACVKKAAANPAYADIRIHTTVFPGMDVTVAQRTDPAFPTPSQRAEIAAWYTEYQACEQPYQRALTSLGDHQTLPAFTQLQAGFDVIYRQLEQGSLSWGDANSRLQATTTGFLTRLDQITAEAQREQKLDEMNAHSDLGGRLGSWQEEREQQHIDAEIRESSHKANK